MRHARNQRRKAALLLRLGAGERERAHGAAVECAQERDDVLAAGVVAGQLERALDGLGAGVAVEELVRPGHGRHGGEPLGQIGQRLVVEIGAGDVDQLGGLLLDGGDHLGMAVAGGDHGDARGKVEKLVAVHVFDADAAAALGHQRIGARIAGRDQPVIGLDGRLALGPGRGQTSFGPYCACSSCLVMDRSPRQIRLCGVVNVALPLTPACGILQFRSPWRARKSGRGSSANRY